MINMLPDIDWTPKTQLLATDIDVLEDWAASGNRGAAYIQLYAWTGVNQ